MAIYTRSSKCCPIRAEEGITGALCPPNSSTKFRDLPANQQIGGYPRPGQLSDSVDEQTLDSEGRCVILEFPAFVLIGVYSPATRDETRTEFREAFIDAMDVRVRNLIAMGKQVFLCGDLNIIRDELDAAGLPERLRKEGMSLEDFFATPSRLFLNHLVFGGRVLGDRQEGREEPVLWDLCREFHPTRAGMYTCWETRKNARPGNFGNRIDYVLCSSGIKDWFIDSNIQEGLLGSDHCPVYATIADTVSFHGSKTSIEDIMNPPGMFKDGIRQREWCQKDLLPISAKLIPEFDRRQSIKDMFFRRTSASTKTKSNPTAINSQSMLTGSDIVLGEGGSEPQKDCGPSGPQQPSQPTSTIAVPSTASNGSTPTSPQKPPSQKRQAGSSMSPTRPQKKGKLALNRESSSKSVSGLSQSSLKGFFKPRTPTTNSSSISEASDTTNVAATPNTEKEELDSKQSRPDDEENNTHFNNDGIQDPIGGSPKPESSSTEKVFDPIEAKESWSKLLGKRVVPRCEHGEDCQLLVTKKAGVNCGM